MSPGLEKVSLKSFSWGGSLLHDMSRDGILHE
jgi:hypothetical protein